MTSLIILLWVCGYLSVLALVAFIEKRINVGQMIGFLLIWWLLPIIFTFGAIEAVWDEPVWRRK